MATLLIEHPVLDFATWQTAFDRFAQRRRAGGVTAERIYQPVDDPAYVVITLDFDAAAQASTFLRFLQEQVWSDPSASPALTGTPRTAILDRRLP
ncbi:hypothetical protein [Pseudonocardia sp. GCM10023141]|uniref:hypothetical protein n=1 Tax=Pseudonocardia sp. GCM10023141 TaxID=3252653 RepID=UPI003607F6CB